MSTGPEEVDLAGRRLIDGRYELVQRLGAGVFGTVWRARELALGQELREVAIKITHARRLSPAQADELLREGRILIQVVRECRRPEARKHFVHVHGLHLCGELDGAGCLVMELIQGVRLLEHITAFRDGLPLSLARRYLIELCTALAACHELSPAIVHGDLKPDNLLVDDTGTLRIADFGLAQRVDKRLGFAAGGPGAIAYVAPEVLKGRTLPQSDLYSMGLIFYEALAGDGPHLHLRETVSDRKTQSFEYLKEKEEMEFAPLRERVNSLGSDSLLLDLVEQCCRFEPRERPTSAEQILTRLVAAPPPAVPTWEQDLEACLERGAYLQGLQALHGAPAGLEPARSAWELVLRSHLNESTRVLSEGGSLLEQDGRRLTTRLRGHLLESLARCARALGHADVALYYEELLGGRRGGP